MPAESPLVYAIGLDSLTARAVYKDLAESVIRRRRPLSASGFSARSGRRPDLVLLDLTCGDVDAELAAARAAWGANVLIVGISRTAPFASVWRQPERAEMTEIGPGFLHAFLGVRTPSSDGNSAPRPRGS